MSGLAVIGKKDAADAEAANRVLIEFANDHDISGAKFDVRDVSPEQIFVAVAYLTRIGNQLLDTAMLASAQGQAQLAAVRSQIERERRS